LFYKERVPMIDACVTVCGAQIHAVISHVSTSYPL